MPNPHSVLTVDLEDDDPDGPTKQTEQRVIAFFRAMTAPETTASGAGAQTAAPAPP
jgi:hypothetical protein